MYSKKNCLIGSSLIIIPEVLPLRLIPFGSKSVNLDKSVVNMAEIINLTENICKVVLGDRHSESVCFWFAAIPNLQSFRYFHNNQLVNFRRTHVNYGFVLERREEDTPYSIFS